MAATSCRVELGFVEECQSWKLRSEYFPSKVGGKPAWLSPIEIPTPTDLCCTACGDPCVFLLQVYAPKEDSPDTFHRSLFVFTCKNSGCPGKERSGRVFRCQLPRSNPYYGFDPTPEDEDISNREASGMTNNLTTDQLCVVCGCAGPKKCANCRAVSYCSKKHQLVHWKMQGHKHECSAQNENLLQNDSEKESCLLREYELVTEPEALDNADEIVPEKSEEERLQEYESFLRSPGAQNIMRFAEQSDLEAMAENRDDKIFRKFKKRTEHEPNQVLRYHPGGEPLWVSSECIPSKEDIPDCRDCGSPRAFEFQVMPQILNHLGLDSLDSSSLDFGTLAIFTCTGNCNQGGPYKKEFLWSQQIS